MSNLEQNIGEQISQVGRHLLFGYLEYSRSHNFPALMVENTYILILQCKIRGQRVLIDRFIVAEHVGRYLYRDTKHTQLVPKGFDQFSFCLITMKPIDNVIVSEVFYRLIYHSMGALFKNIRTTVWDILVALSPAWSASTKQCGETTLPFGFGASSGMASLAFRYKSYQSCAAKERLLIFGC